MGRGNYRSKSGESLKKKGLVDYVFQVSIKMNLLLNYLHPTSTCEVSQLSIMEHLMNIIKGLALAKTGMSQVNAFSIV